MKTSRLTTPAPALVGDLHAEGKADNSSQTIVTLASIISHLTQVTSFSQPDTLLRFAAKNIPSLIGGAGCSIYLRPDLALKYDGLLQDENQQPIQAKDIAYEFVVLSASTRPDLEPLIGKAFYPVDLGLSRRVLGQGLPLRLKNYTDVQEQLATAPGLHWQDRYGDEKYYRYLGSCRPLLIVPLTAKAGALGFIVFPATVDDKPFTRLAEEIAVIVAQSLANALERTWYIREQDRHIRHLVDIGAKHQLGEIYEAVTQRLGSMLNARECQLYVRVDGGSGAQLAAEDGRILEAGAGKTYRPGQDVIGWVFKTGFPLLIPDTDEFTCDDDACTVDLERLLLGARLNSEDGILKCDQPLPGPASLLVIPIQNHNGLVLGVLSCRRTLNTRYRPGRPFDQDDLHVALSFAGMIALAIERERQERLSGLLTDLGLCSDPSAMFDLVVRQMPQLISALDCNIYLLETGNGTPTRLRLTRTSGPSLANLVQAPALNYQIGEGKTGFSALARNTLVVNHYGIGEADRHLLEAERSRSRTSRPNDLLEKLVDERGRMVGLISLKQGADAPLQIQQAFHLMVRQQVASQATGLTSPKLADYQRWGVRPAWSFAVVAIKSDQDELHGVMSVGRPVPGTPFSADDLALIESIAGRLASAIHTVKVQERQSRLMVTLAHEISTPLQGILADAENLISELPDRHELSQLAGHTLHQVQQLHLLTETIMTVLAERSPTRSFAVHNLARPLKDACRMFTREAAAKGCDILEPRAVESRFPDIEMSLFDLTIAFKNLVHNAVKYSFQPPRQWEGNRYIRVIGRWADEQQQLYSVSIENYGVGIPQCEIDSGAIFLPHYRGVKASDRGRTGAGLGLAHARQIVEDLHHGAINVTSKKVTGEAYLTTFTVILPVRQASNAH
jgi:signal transduction histidine kinase